jgi:hypothetical protein
MTRVNVEEDFIKALIKTSLGVQAQPKPSFKSDPNKGEGTASKMESEFNDTLLGYLRQVYDEVKKIPAKESPDQAIQRIDTLIAIYKNDCQMAVRKYLTDVFHESQMKANKISSDKGLPTSNDDTILTKYLIPYQINAVNKNATILRETLVDLIYRQAYFNQAYPKK